MPQWPRWWEEDKWNFTVDGQFWGYYCKECASFGCDIEQHEWVDWVLLGPWWFNQNEEKMCQDS